MYEKDEDEGNVGAQWRMAKEIFKGERGGANSHHPLKNPVTNSIIKTTSQVMIDAGTSEFEDHEDVMAKLLGEA